MKKIAFLLIGTVLSVIVFTDCASIVSKSSYPVSINCEPAGSKIKITNKQGMEIYSGTAPATVQLKASAGFFSPNSYTVEFRNDGYETQTQTITCSIDGWYIGNLLFGGLIGMLIVDPATGAMWQVDNRFINKTLYKLTSNNSEPTLHILDINEVPENIKLSLKRIN